MTPKTKAFMKELSDLLCKYDAEISTTAWYDGATEMNISLDKTVVLSEYGDITWQEIDRMLEG